MKLKNKNLQRVFYPATISKKAQIGETITWVVATVIIIVILILSIFIAGFVGKDKEFQILSKKDLLATKSLSGYLLTQNDSGEKVFEQLKNEENLNDFNGHLAKKIFGFYEDKYFGIWLGVSREKCTITECFKSNNYFDEKVRRNLEFVGDYFSSGILLELKDKNLILFLDTSK